jgi:hypothetical protein
VAGVKNLFVIGFLFAAASLSSGCTVAAYKAMEEVDKAISKIAQSDCELVRVFHGKEVCREEVAAEQTTDTVYCYRRLGGVDCYVEREPMDKPINREVRSKPAAEAPAAKVREQPQSGDTPYKTSLIAN